MRWSKNSDAGNYVKEQRGNYGLVREPHVIAGKKEGRKKQMIGTI
jgi:hypothetical protein